MDYESAPNETRTDREQSETHGDFRVSFESEPLPYTLRVKGRFWYFRTRKHGRWHMRGEWFERCPEIETEIARLKPTVNIAIEPVGK